MKKTIHSPRITTLNPFWTPEQCQKMIAFGETQGFMEATVNTSMGERRVDRLHNNDRVLFDDAKLAQSIWEAVQEYVPAQIGQSVAVGLNERFRIYRYEPGQVFQKHRDESFIRNDTEASYYTLMIYLNKNFEGGETTFSNIQIKPEKGSCLLFLHQLEHEGRERITGVNYVLRTDVMYQLQ